VTVKQHRKRDDAHHKREHRIKPADDIAINDNSAALGRIEKRVSECAYGFEFMISEIRHVDFIRRYDPHGKQNKKQKA